MQFRTFLLTFGAFGSAVFNIGMGVGGVGGVEGARGLTMALLVLLVLLVLFLVVVVVVSGCPLEGVSMHDSSFPSR